ncbi:MAG TPA: replication-relaxation family protein [Solirubrobacteraceae bacterium]|jgi:hypothetical protein|nr:replication-relaxation family protein [Solirubrobacteraceae bacterium]
MLSRLPLWHVLDLAALVVASLAALLLCAAAGLLALCRRARNRRRYVRMRVDAYRTDSTSVEGLVAMYEALHKRLQRRWWRRLAGGQPSVALEAHYIRDERQPPRAMLAVACPAGMERLVEAALRSAYPNCCLAPWEKTLALSPRAMSDAPAQRPRREGGSRRAPARQPPIRRIRMFSGRTPTSARRPALLRLKKRASFIKRVKHLDRYELAREPPIDRLLTVMGACGEQALVQLALTPVPALFERYAKWRLKQHEDHLSRARREHLLRHDRSQVEEAEVRGGLEVQHRPLYFADVRVVAPSRRVCEQIASELRAEGAENRLIERGTAVRHGVLGLYERRLERGEGNPWPGWHRGVLASPELAAMWQLPSIDYATVPLARTALPLAPAPPAIMRPHAGGGVLCDALGAVAIHPAMRRLNTAVPGAVDQGKSSFLAATVAEDLRRERCAVIVLDPKGDAAQAAVSAVPPRRTCTLLDLAHPTCGFNPLAVEAPADTIADYVVGALKGLFTDADIRASSDRYLRNAIIAVLAHDRNATLWDAARLLSVGEEGYAYRAKVGAHVRTLPQYSEIAQFFTAELTAQLADSRSTTTAKLDAPVNKLARLLNSPSIKRVLLNDSLRIDLDGVIAREEVLVVKGALGAMGAGNTSVLMQLLVGMLDAALARQQDAVAPEQRVTVALKVDEAPLAINRGFAETLALKRSAGLETVACWQTDAQWTERELRDQLDALFAHRVHFATASATDARNAARLMMAQYSDTVRPEIPGLTALGRPDARLHLPRHHAIVSWVTPEGRQAPFVASTIPLQVDEQRIALHAARQAARGGRYLADLSQPHWERSRETPAGSHPRDRQWPPLPDVAADSYAELVALDRAQRLRWAKAPAAPVRLEPDPLDVEILALVASMRHVLTSQIHRRFNRARALTTTQRRLKRLSDAGLVARFQFHRRDGGGAPMCYVIAPAGVELLRARGSSAAGGQGAADDHAASSSSSSSSSPAASTSDARLRRARHDVHVTGWLLALERAMGGGGLRARGPEESVLSPPLRAAPSGRVAIGPGELRLGGGRVAHDFLRTGPDGRRVAVERFDTVRPDASVEVPRAGVCVLIERDDRLTGAGAVAKLERYDHLLAGWLTCLPRFTRHGALPPLVVYLCRDRARARECARWADHLLRACRAYPGEHPCGIIRRNGTHEHKGERHDRPTPGRRDRPRQRPGRPRQDEGPRGQFHFAPRAARTHRSHVRARRHGAYRRRGDARNQRQRRHAVGRARRPAQSGRGGRGRQGGRDRRRLLRPAVPQPPGAGRGRAPRRDGRRAGARRRCRRRVGSDRRPVVVRHDAGRRQRVPASDGQRTQRQRHARRCGTRRIAVARASAWISARR